MKAKLLTLAALVMVASGCQTITEELPSQPVQANPVITIPLPVAPATPTPKPTATPTPKPTANPTPTPTPEPTPTPSGPTGSCVPTPPGLHHIGVAVHNDMGFKKIIDSAPIVCDRAYCSQIMNDPTRSCCPVKPEGHPDRETCEALVVGLATDTGRPGPTWSLDGKPCFNADPGGTASRCINHWDNPFLLVVHGSGHVKACSSLTGICGQVTVP